MLPESPESPETPPERPVPSLADLERARQPAPPGLVMGRPVEDRSFEVLVTGIGTAAGLAIGAAVAGPGGVAVGGLAGAAVGLVTGEVIERAAGPAATTTDCVDLPEPSIEGPADASVASSIGSAHAGTSHRQGAITYPTDCLLAVADTETETAAAVAALAGAGLPASAVVVIPGPEGEGFGRLGPRPNPLSRFVRMIQFTTMDQTPDFSAYEAALLDGRTVIGVRIHADDVPVVRDVLVASGLHFLNFYGRWSTREVSQWRGPEIDLPDYLRR